MHECWYCVFMFQLKYSLGIFKAVNSKQRYCVEMLSFLTQISGGGAEKTNSDSLAKTRESMVVWGCIGKNHVKQNWRQRLVDRCFQYGCRQYVVILNYDWWQTSKKNLAAIVYFWIKPIFLRLNLSYNNNSSSRGGSSDSDNARTKSAKQEKLIKYTPHSTQRTRERSHLCWIYVFNAVDFTPPKNKCTSKLGMK